MHHLWSGDPQAVVGVPGLLRVRRGGCAGRRARDDVTDVPCLRCHRRLTSPLWRARRIGPKCAQILGLVPSPTCPTVLIRAVRGDPGEGQLSLFEIIEKGAA